VTSVVSLSNGLTALGHEVRILTLSGDRHSRVDGNVTYIGSVGVGRIYPNARMRTAPSGRYIGELVDWRPDIVHSQCEFSTFFLAKKISKACRCPLVHTYHTVYEDFTHYFSPSVHFGKYMAAMFSRMILAKTQAVVVPTEKIRRLLNAYGVRKPISTVPSGLELERFAIPMGAEERKKLRTDMGLADTDMALIYLGRLAQEKNIEALLSLLSRRDDPHVRLVLAGDGPYRENLEETTRALHLEDRVIFTGMIPPAEVARYYKAGDIFVSASRSETQGLTYIEAMACGLPLLCRQDPCLDDVIQNDVSGCVYRDEADFYEKLSWLLSDEERRRAIGKAAKETTFRRFSSRTFAENVLDVYKKQLRCENSTFSMAAAMLSRT
jgi:1,2-diacylglycerol 3-alpha-glucosyltransferase